MAATEQLNPVGQGDYADWTAYGGGTAEKYARVADRGDADADDDGITSPWPGDHTKFETYYFAALTEARSTDRIVRVVLHVRVGVTLNTTNPVLYPRARRNSVDVDLPPVQLVTGSSAGTVTWAERAIDFSSYRPEGGTWQLADVGPGPSTSKAQFGFAAGFADGEAYTPHAAWVQLEIAYQPLGVLQPVVRRTASTTAWRARRAPGRVSVMVPPSYGGLELGDDVYVSDTLGPTPEGEGWSLDPDAARPAQVREITEDLQGFTLTASGLLLRQHLVTLADSGRIIGDVRAADGLLRLDPAVADTFLCSSKRWVEGPDGLVAEVAVDDPAVDRHGRLHHGAVTNRVLYSAFQNWGAAWTLTGGAAYVTDSPLFESRVGARILETPSGGQAVQTGIVLSRGGTTVLSVDYRCLGAGGAGLIIQRHDGQYWNATTSAFQAAAVTNTLAASAERTRGVVRIVNALSGASYTLTLKPAGSTAVRWWHVQSELSPRGRGWASSLIVTLGAAASRAHSYLATPNNAGARTFPGQDGTYRLRFRPAWASDDVAAPSAPAMVLWRAAYAADEARLAYLPGAAVGTPGVFEFRRVTGVTTTSVTLQRNLVAEEDVRVVCRWQSRSQNGDAPGTLSLWVDGTVARVVGPAAITETSPASLVRGGSADADGTQAEGWIWDEVVSAFVLSDGELEEVW